MGLHPKRIASGLGGMFSGEDSNVSARSAFSRGPGYDDRHRRFTGKIGGRTAWVQGYGYPDSVLKSSLRSPDQFLRPAFPVLAFQRSVFIANQAASAG